MDISKVDDLRAIAVKQTELAIKYCEYREKAGKAKADVEILLTACLPEIRSEKKNVGYELALLMLCERNEVAKGLYSEWQENEAKYKGLERLLDSYATRISLEQSIFRFCRDGEKWGS